MKVIKIFLLFLCLITVFSLFACEKTENNSPDSILNTENIKGGIVSLYIDSEDSQKGKINGRLTFKKEGSYDIFFYGENAEPLDGYTKIDSFTATDKNRVYEINDLVLPPLAVGIRAVSDKGTGGCRISDKYLLLSEDVYVFGAVSDVHFNRYNISGGDDALIYFDLALDYFDKIGADFVGVAGDISASGEISALEKFNDMIETRDYPVYTVSGNHDVNAISDGSWAEYINSGAFDKKDCSFAENGIDFVYTPKDLDGDVFVFLNQMRWEYNTETSTLLDITQLQWLRKVLEDHKEQTVYLFFHTFLCGPDGEKHTGVGNIKNPGGYTYPLPYTFGASDEVVFRNLLKQYKNVVFFSGHSHWMFEMEIYGENANYSNFDGEYCHMVHVPSITEPRYLGETDESRTGRTGEYSQGWVIYDYGDITVLIPVDFISQSYYTQYIEIIYN